MVLMRVVAVVMAVFSGISVAAGENITFPDAVGAVNIKTTFGAKGDGVTDDTAAFQKAVDELRGKNTTLYFPNGTYLLSDSVGIFNGKPHSRDRFMTWQGQSEAGVVFKLKDNAPGFDDPAKPKILLSMYEGQSTGDAMHTYARNLTVDVGSGNPGVAAFRFMTNNIGAMDRITLKSSDPAGAGAIGLDLRQSQNGPGLIKNVTVIGFDRGVETGNSFSLVLEHLTLRNQRQVGFNNIIARITLRGLRSENAVPAVINGKNAHLTLIDADLTGGSADQTAIVSADPKIYLRDIRQSGYGHTIRDSKGQHHDDKTIDEWFEGKGQSLFGAAPRSLRLPIEETPEVPWENDPAKWFTVEAEGDITQALQEAIDQAAAGGKTTLYFKPADGKQRITGPIRIHGSINRVIGMQSLVNVADPEGKLKDAAVFTLEDLASDTIVFERFFLLGGWKAPAHAVMIANKSGKTVVLKDIGIGGITKAPDPGGRWFIEDVSPSRTSTLAIGKGERIWARQYNPETPEADMIAVDGGQLWILGLKTEGRTRHVVATHGAKAEVLGGVAYQSWGKQPLDPPMFDITDSDCSFTLGFYHHKDPFATIVQETLRGQTRTLKRDDLTGYHLPVYRSGR